MRSSAIWTGPATTRAPTAPSGRRRAAARWPSSRPWDAGPTAFPRAPSSAWCGPRRSSAGNGGEPVEPAPEKGYIDSNGLAVAPASAPDEVKAIIAAGNRIATKPYKYGGGHGSWNDSGYDCSGSVSYVLHAAGLLSRALDSTGFMSYGDARARHLGHHPQQPEPRLHDRRRPALRHERPRADRIALERADALGDAATADATPRDSEEAPWHCSYWLCCCSRPSSA